MPTSPPTTPELLLSHVEWVRRLAATLVSGAADAEDVAQETWRVALEHPPRHSGQLRHWLALVTRNVARSIGAAARCREEHEGRVVPPELAPSAAEMVERAQLQRRVVDAVLALEEPYRSTLLWRFFEDLAPSVIAARERVPVETVKTRLKRGLARLREQLQRDFGGERGGWALALAPLAIPRPGIAAGATAAAASIGGGALVMSKGMVALAATIVLAAAFGFWRMLGPRPPTGTVRDGALAEASPASASAPAAPAAVTLDRSPEPPAPPSSRPAESASPLDLAEPPPSLAGIVVDSAGARVAGARLFLSRESNDAYRSAEAFLQHVCFTAVAEMREREDLLVATSDADGSFRFARARDDVVWNLAAMHAELGVGLIERVLGPAARAPRRCEVRLLGGVVLTGRVFDPDATPLPNARVDVRAYREFDVPDESVGWPIWRGRTDESGAFRTFALPFHDFELEATTSEPPGQQTLAGVRSGTVHVEPEVREKRVDLQLESVVTRSGRLLAPDGQSLRLSTIVPDAGAKGPLVVFATDIEPRAWKGLASGGKRPRSSHVTLDGPGSIDVAHDRYAVTVREPGMRWIAVLANDALGPLLGSAEIDRDAAGPDVVVDLSTLARPRGKGELLVEIVDAATDEPLGGGQLDVAESFQSSPGTVTVTNERFEVPDDGVVRTELRECQARVTLERDGFVSTSASVEVRSSRRTEATLRAAPATRSLRGRVLDTTGAPVFGARVRPYWRLDDRLEALPSARAESDSAGRFEARGLPEAPLVLVAGHFDRASAVREVAVGVSDVGDVAFPQGVAVFFTARPSNDAAAGPMRYRVIDASGLPVLDQLSDADNGFYGSDRLRLWFPVGDYVAEACSPGFEPTTLPFRASSGAEILFTLRPIGE